MCRKGCGLGKGSEEEEQKTDKGARDGWQYGGGKEKECAYYFAGKTESFSDIICAGMLKKKKTEKPTAVQRKCRKKVKKT